MWFRSTRVAAIVGGEKNLELDPTIGCGVIAGQYNFNGSKPAINKFVYAQA
jgi:hypothetical protein